MDQTNNKLVSILPSPISRLRALIDPRKYIEKWYNLMSMDVILCSVENFQNQPRTESGQNKFSTILFDHKTTE